MNLYIVFEKNTTSNAYFIVGVADNQLAADKIASYSLAKGQEYSAYTDTYEIHEPLGRDCWVVYVKNSYLDPEIEEEDSGRVVFGKLYHTMENPSSADIRIHADEDISKEDASHIIKDLGGDSYEHSDKLASYCVNVRINDLVDY